MEYNASRIFLEKPVSKSLATGKEYGVLLIQKGSVTVEETWHMGQEDLLVCKPRQTLHLEYAGGHCPLSAVFVRLSEALLESFSTEKTDLLFAFEINPAPVTVLRGKSELLMLLKNLSLWLVDLPGQTDRYASDILEDGTLKMFVSLLLRTCIQADLNRVDKPSSFALDNVFNFIHAHLTEDLSLDRLEKEFYVSRHHLIRQFKLHTGQTVHQYIVKARLDLSRSYIEQGLTVSAASRRSGFPSYNHFFRAFRQEYGMTPMEYYRQTLAETASTEEAPNEDPV